MKCNVCEKLAVASIGPNGECEEDTRRVEEWLESANAALPAACEEHMHVLLAAMLHVGRDPLLGTALTYFAESGETTIRIHKEAFTNSGIINHIDRIDGRY